ncbi:unnamed protein product [Brassica napus]|uniref:(rape) hypothetical protein n=1 Tax=Brassica napus TaxID=3708 RepID=A0A816Q4V3_BRANA|nr:unnamed protein product [Brassica napus]
MGKPERKAREKTFSSSSYFLRCFGISRKIHSHKPTLDDDAGQDRRRWFSRATKCRLKNCQIKTMPEKQNWTIEDDKQNLLRTPRPFQGVVFPYISSTGNCNIIVDAGFERDDEMNDERVDLIIDMYRKKYDWSKHVWGYQETEQPYADSSEDDGSKEEEAGERSDCGMEEEIETAHVSPTKKRKNQYQDIGAESRKKRDLEEGMKSHIQGMFKSSFTALGLEVRDLIEDRFTKLEQTILSSQTPVGVPAYTHGAAPAYTQTHGAAPAYTQTHGAALTYTHTPAAATTSTQAPGSDSTVAPTPVSTHASAPATTSRARASRNKASVPSHTGGPATAAKTRSQTKDPELSDVFGSLFDTLDFNLGTQEHLQKTMGNLTQESHVFDCGGKKNNKAVEAFAVLIPRIVKVVQSSDKKKDFNVKQYVVSYVPMRALNTSGNDCGAYSLKFIECHLLGLDFSLVNDDNIQEARHKIAFDLWEAANDEALQYRMSTFKPPKRAPEKTVELF